MKPHLKYRAWRGFIRSKIKNDEYNPLFNIEGASIPDV
jgi:hypothetical protein